MIRIFEYESNANILEKYQGQGFGFMGTDGAAGLNDILFIENKSPKLIKRCQIKNYVVFFIKNLEYNIYIYIYINHIYIL